jgi:hypothetical protein
MGTPVYSSTPSFLVGEAAGKATTPGTKPAAAIYDVVPAYVKLGGWRLGVLSRRARA